MNAVFGGRTPPLPSKCSPTISTVAILAEIRRDRFKMPGHMQAFKFHPAVARWFEEKFGSPTEPQERGWPAIQSGAHTLIAAPTGSGKTLAAFLASLDQLFRDGLAGDLKDETRVLYVSPLKALSNDIHKNLEEPLAGIRTALRESGGSDVDVRAAVRTGDTPAAKRQAITRR